PSHTYAYTGQSSITSTLVYTTTDASGNLVTTTDVAVLVPETTLAAWTGSYTSFVVVTTSAIDSNGKPVKTTYTVAQVPSSTCSTSTWSNSFTSTVVTTIGTTVTTVVCVPSSTSDVSVNKITTEPNYITTTWSNSYTSTIIATSGTTVTTIVCVPSSSTITKTSTECAKCQTFTWYKSYSTTATTSVSGAISTIIYVPSTTSTLSNQKPISGSAGTITGLTTSTKTELTGITLSTVPTSIEFGATTKPSVSTASGSSTANLSAIYEGSGYKLGNSVILALAAYMLVI
ncbi:MAG: hypothetical protein K0Q49_2371, partial [Haloplasmataceae bacterium]|nr:hypothetical protein [Haloplasmataceae bacterium]